MPDSAGIPSAPPELYGCPVRTRYVRQVLRYGASNARWIAALHEGAAGRIEGAERRLRALLETAERATRYWPEAFANAGVAASDARSVDDLAHFPTLSRATLQARYHDLFHRDVAEHEIDEGWLGTSSGSTGEPVRFFMDARSIHFFTAFIGFLWERHALGARPFPGRSGIVLLCTLPRSAIYRTYLPLFGFTGFRKLHWAEPDAPGELARMAPPVITGDPDSLARLLDDGVRVRPKLILSSAFPLSESLAERLRRATGAVVVDYYSMAETGPLAWKCTAGAGVFHVADGAAIVESIEGELAVTNLRNPLFPLIRYRTGDLGEVDRSARACRCGVRGTTITRFAGRVSARFVAADGRHVDPGQLQPILSALPLRQFQLVQTAPNSVTLRVHGAERLDLRPLDAGVARLLGAKPRISLRRERAPLFRPGEKPLPYVRRTDAPRAPID